MSALNLSKNEAENRYELEVDGERIGLIDYRATDSVTDMYHTEVDPAHGGKGYGQQLAKFALDDARARDLKVKPTCPFIAKYIAENDEYSDLLA